MFHNADLVDIMPNLERFAYKLTKTKDEAIDLLQETLLKAIEKKDLFQAGTNLFSWSSKIMYNLFVSKYRRRVKYTTQYDPEPYIKKSNHSASQELSAELHTVEEAMQKLSPEHRQVLIMVSVKDMKYQEAANELGIPVGTVRSRLFRARENLKHLIDEEDLFMTLPEPVFQHMPFYLAA